jgi:branched-chain amino acid transport system substrate-binding protein
MRSKRRYSAIAGTAAALLVVTACGSSSKSSSATTASSAGSSPTSAVSSTKAPINVGMIVDLTGPGASTYAIAVKGAQARIDLQNAQGGVDGRQLKLYTADDAGSPTQAATAAQDLVSQHHPVVILADSDVTLGATTYLHSIDMPTFGDGEDGPEWGEQPNTNMFALSGDFSPVSDNQDSNAAAQFLKDRGATNAASLGYGEFPSAVAAAKYFTAEAKSVGMKVGLEDYSVPVTGMNAVAIALQMKSAGVNTMDMALQTASALQVLVAVKQEGLQMKAPFVSTGYGQDLLDDPAAVQAGQGAYFEADQVPTEEKTPATLAQSAALLKYSGYTGDPPLNLTFGWLNADLAIRGLQAAGSNPTSTSIINAVRNLKDWTGGGLLATPRDFSLADFGKSPEKQCYYFVQLEGKKFIPVPANGSPTCGTRVNL